MNNSAWHTPLQRKKKPENLGIPDPMVISPLSSTSWQTMAFEWSVNLSRLQREVSCWSGYHTEGDSQHIGGIEGKEIICPRLANLEQKRSPKWRSRYGLSDWGQLQYASPSSFLPQRILRKPNKILHLASTSAFVTGLYGFIRNTPHAGVLVGAAAINSGITAGTFFSESALSNFCTLFSFVPLPRYSWILY